MKAFTRKPMPLFIACMFFMQPVRRVSNLSASGLLSIKPITVFAEK
jgi:hypothetical protein